MKTSPNISDEFVSGIEALCAKHNFSFAFVRDPDKPQAVGVLLAASANEKSMPYMEITGLPLKAGLLEPTLAKVS